MRMQFRDISTDKKTAYRIGKDERVVFFMKNRSGALEFTLAGPGAEAHVFALFEGTQGDRFSLNLTQHHRAPDTKSSALVKGILTDDASFSYEGLVRIEKGATGSDATQENRNLLLSETASAVSIPSLEILENDVACGHASTTGTLSEEAILYMKTRGLSQTDAERLLADGFVNSFYDEIARYGKFFEGKTQNPETQKSKQSTKHGNQT